MNRPRKLKGSLARSLKHNSGINFTDSTPDASSKSSAEVRNRSAVTSTSVGINKPTLGQMQPSSSQTVAPSYAPSTVSSGYQPNVNLTKPKFVKVGGGKKKKVVINL
jgi:hypothetical protein